MSTPENQLLSLKDEAGRPRPVFLLLTGQEGDDFTFYVRDDRDKDTIRQILRGESGEQTPLPTVAGDDRGVTQAASPEKEQRFSCRVNVLRPRLRKDDLKACENGQAEPVFLRELRKAKGEDAASSDYARLWQALNDGLREKLDAGALADKELPELVEELNRVMWDGFTAEDGDDHLPDAEKELLGRASDAARTILGNYLRFCLLFKDAIEPIDSRLRIGRGLTGLCYEGDCWSISFRIQDTKAGFAPPKKAGVNLNSIEEICFTLYEEIFYAVSRSESAREGGARVGAQTAEPREEKAQPAQGYNETLEAHRREPLAEVGGLVVIAGSTNSAKSLITRGLIHLYLENVLQDYWKSVLQGEEKRRPHLVSVEDPVEKYFTASAPTVGDGRALRLAADGPTAELIDYTPRQLGVDTPDLETALHDALRQTPKVLFVGETRHRDDWRKMIDFSGTGHLVVTTAHAGSLIEAMHKILLATKARTPAARNEVASRLLAVIHLKRAEVVGFDKCRALIPSLWRRVPQGVTSLTADGLASILPHSHSGEENPCSCLGRKYFVERLLRLSASHCPEGDFKSALREKAIKWDLKGE